MLRLLLTLALALTTASAFKLSSNLRKKRNKKRITIPTNTAGLELIQLPAASHDDLMSHIRAHPTWFVHMNFDGKHTITKLPPAGKAGDTALNLLQLHISMELGTRDEHGIMERTQLHELDWSSLSDADKATVETIASNINVDTLATQVETACPSHSYIKTATFDEVDRTHVAVNPVCGQCAPHCEVCIGEGMELCMKCAPEDGQETFLARLGSLPDVCLTEKMCNDAGRNISDVFCKPDYKNTGGKVATDEEIFAMAMKDEENADLHTLPIANSILQANGHEAMEPNAFKNKLHLLHENEKNEYIKLHVPGMKEKAETEFLKLKDFDHPASGGLGLLEKEAADTDGQDDEAKLKSDRYKIDDPRVQTNLLEIKSMLKTGINMASEQEVGIPVVDTVCDIYKQGWVDNVDVHRYLGGIIFGYDEGEDAQLTSELASKTSFYDMYDTAVAAPAAHAMGLGKTIAMLVDEKKSRLKGGDSIWCQSMAIVEGLEAKIDNNSQLKTFLDLAQLVVAFLQKTIGSNKLIQRMFVSIRNLFTWMDRMRRQWAARLVTLQKHVGYRQGVSGMCKFSKKFRSFLSKMQAMCHVNDVMNAGRCQATQLMNNVGSDVDQLSQATLQSAQADAAAYAAAMAAQLGETNAANAAEKFRPVKKTWELMGQGITLANTVSGYVSPLWAFLEADHVIQFGCVCVPYWYVDWNSCGWSGCNTVYAPQCGCTMDTTINIMNLFQSFSNILNQALQFLQTMFQPLIDAVNTEIDNLKTVALDWLEEKFKGAFDLDDLLVIPKLIEGFQTTKTDIMSRVNAALPIDTMLNGFQVAKTQMLAMSDQDESDCKQRPQYIEIQSGTCASHAGYGLITSSEECAAALAAIFSVRPLLHASQIQCSRVCQLKESSITLPTYVIDKENAGCNNHAAIQIGSIYDQDNADTNTVSKCAAKCSETSGCVHFSFGKNSRVNDCILLNGPCTYGNNPNWNQYTPSPQ